MADDEDLWHEITKGVTPLEDRPKADLPKNTRPNVQNPRDAKTGFDDKIIYSNNAPTKPISQSQLTKREARRISRGTTDINSTIDLHGFTRDVAYSMLVKHIGRAFDRGEKLVLVITGRGGSYKPQDRTTPLSQKRFSDIEKTEGVLKQALPGWLQGEDLNHKVSSFKIAAQHHGGAGAFYVRLRRNKN